MQRPASGSGHSRLSRPTRTNCWPKSTTVCPRSLRRATIPAGSVTSLIRVSPKVRLNLGKMRLIETKKIATLCDPLKDERR
jgi:hypothetical protein